MEYQTTQLTESSPTIHTQEDAFHFLENFAEAIRNGNVDTIMSFYSDNIVAFDMMPPLAFSNKRSYRESWEKCFTDFFQFPVNFSFVHQTIETQGDLSVAHSFVHMAGDSIHGENMETWLRNTIVLKKENRDWKIIHEHNSVPIDNITMKGMMNLTPVGGEAYQH